MPIAIAYVAHFNTPPGSPTTASAEPATATAAAGQPTVSTGGAPTPPSSAFALGSVVGVPTGTTLTTRTSLGSANGGSETFDLLDRITSASATRNVTVYRGLRFTQTITTPTPAAGTSVLFEDCSFEGLGFWNVEVNGSGGSTNVMEPLVIFNRCNFDGGGAGGTDKNMIGGYCWVIDCDMRGAEDAWAGWAFSRAIHSNFEAYGADIDMHSDGVQCLDTGRSSFYHCWLSAGVGPGASQAFRVGTEGGAVQDVAVYYCGVDRGGYAMQFRGDAGAGDIANVQVVGCRWTRNHAFGPIDVEQTTGMTWTDNAYFDGEVIPSPV